MTSEKIEKEKIVKALLSSLTMLHLTQLDDAIQLLKTPHFKKNLFSHPDFNAALTQFIYNLIKNIDQSHPHLLAKNNPTLNPLKEFLCSDKMGPMHSKVSLQPKTR